MGGELVSYFLLACYLCAKSELSEFFFAELTESGAELTEFTLPEQ